MLFHVTESSKQFVGEVFGPPHLTVWKTSCDQGWPSSLSAHFFNLEWKNHYRSSSKNEVFLQLNMIS